ncbi:hypothetical protein DRH14_02865 [Candidatus Shapirobacteria bacterium]|nr:MAG: hypothetical protein DRH14_02865 [Candidatus Shapirobacteria bacterium]
MENKEKLNQTEKVNKKKLLESRQNRVEMQEVSRDLPLPREVKSWMEKIEDDPQKQKSFNDDDLKQASQSDDDDDNTDVDKIKELPISRLKFSGGFKKKISQAGRWLSTFVFRIIKKNRGEVKFKEDGKIE